MVKEIFENNFVFVCECCEADYHKEYYIFHLTLYWCEISVYRLKIYKQPNTNLYLHAYRIFTGTAK